MYAALARDVIVNHAREPAQVLAGTLGQPPLFLYMAFQNSHAPYQCPTEYLDKVRTLRQPTSTLP